MSSLYDELSERLAKDPSLMKRGGPRVDLSLLLFNSRESLRELWEAAAAVAQAEPETPETQRLASAVEALRPVFGER